jgi:DNA modification methylase|tara:strand:- start:846 stop:2042 length:1197 start_codon:yes stop_codon:yes gene_type:complete
MITQQVSTNSVIPYSKNPRKNKDAIKKVASSIREFGFKQPIVVDKDMVIVAGHTRLYAAKKLNLDKVPIVVADDLTDAQIKAYRIADNRVSQESEWDYELLKLEFNDLVELDFNLLDTGFDQEELDKLLDIESEGLTDEDAVPDTPEEPITKLGDIYILGNHKLMCGDSTSIDAVDKLMDGAKADMVFTDPPYRMDVEGGINQPIGKAAAKLGGSIKHLCDFDPNAFLNTMPTVFPLRKMNAYIFCNKDLVPDYLNWGVESGYAFNILFWKKPNAIPLGGQWRPDVEYLLVFRKSATWNNAVPDVNYSKSLEHKRENHTSHPTMKPVALIENQLKIASNTRSIVIDLFGGSGSTMIACEKTRRNAYLMELDPKYCDVIVKRWEDYTGKKAELEKKEAA